MVKIVIEHDERKIGTNDINVISKNLIELSHWISNKFQWIKTWPVNLLMLMIFFSGTSVFRGRRLSSRPGWRSHPQSTSSLRPSTSRQVASSNSLLRNDIWPGKGSEGLQSQVERLLHSLALWRVVNSQPDTLPGLSLAMTGLRSSRSRVISNDHWSRPMCR